ncbi:unnamed protein product, partial [Staurois parvus]
MIGTSYRGPVRRSVFHCVRRTQRAPDRGAARSQGARTSRSNVSGWNGQAGKGRCLSIVFFFFFFFFFLWHVLNIFVRGESYFTS